MVGLPAINHFAAVKTNRRAFFGRLAFVVTALPCVARAQPSRKVYRIGLASVSSASDHVGPQPRSPYTQAFLRQLHELGYVYGENFVTEPRGAEGKSERYSIV